MSDTSVEIQEPSKKEKREHRFQAKQEREQDVEKLRQEIWNVLENMPSWKELDPIIKNTQNSILKNLPTNFWVEFKGHLLAEDYYPSEDKDKNEPEKLNRLGRGKIFEQLAIADPDICPHGETQAAKALRELMANPDRTGLFGKRGKRNPDVPDIDMKKMVIFGWLECKLSKFNQRALDQFDPKTGFKSSFKQTIKAIISTSDEILEKHGLGIFAGNQNKLRLLEDKELKLRLAIPRGINVNDLINTDALSEEDKNKFREFLKSYEVKISPFSVGEVMEINNLLIGKFIQEQGITFR